jgi:hypothetical protein
VDNAGRVSIKTSGGATVATFKVSGTYRSANFTVGPDSAGHVLVAYAAAVNLLRRYESQFAMAVTETHNGVFGWDSLLPPVSGAETHGGEFDFRHEPYAGSARDAWGVGAGRNDQIAHGPGSSA